jgi:hypothetical protein
MIIPIRVKPASMVGWRNKKPGNDKRQILLLAIIALAGILVILFVKQKCLINHAVQLNEESFRIPGNLYYVNSKALFFCFPGLLKPAHYLEPLK